MNCSWCNTAIELGQQRTEHLCGCISHTTCMYRHFGDEIWHLHRATCQNCNTVLFQPPIDQHIAAVQNAEERINALLQNDAFKTDMKKVRKQKNEANKARTTMLHVLLEQRQIFRNLTTPLTQEIKQHKQNCIRMFKLHENTILYRRKEAAANAALTRLGRKYALNRQEMRVLTFGRRVYSWRRSIPSLARSKFRVRL